MGSWGKAEEDCILVPGDPPRACGEGGLGTWRHRAGDGDGERRVGSDSQMGWIWGWHISCRGKPRKESIVEWSSGQIGGRDIQVGWMLLIFHTFYAWEEKRHKGGNGICGHISYRPYLRPIHPKKGLRTVNLCASQGPSRTQKTHANWVAGKFYKEAIYKGMSRV